MAIILPLPISSRDEDFAVNFISLENYNKFFADLDKGLDDGFGDLCALAGELSVDLPKLKVHQVGAYDASFVPTIADFQRLDSRFQLPNHVWEQLPQYHDYGFAVFKLRAGKDYQVHPMAFEFATRFPDKLFFPTIHVHDRLVHQYAEFSHALYYQGETFRHLGICSEKSAKYYMNMRKAKDIINGEEPCRKVILDGIFKNQDYVISK